MDTPFLYFLALLATLLLFLSTRARLSHNPNPNKRKLPPPGPPSLPVIGHLHLLKEPFHRTLESLSRRYGPVFHLRLGCRPFLIVSSPQAAEQCLTHHDVVFANRPPFAYGEILGYNYTVLAWALYGDLWRNLRRVVTLDALSSQRLQQSSRIRVEEVRFAAKEVLLGSGSGKVNLSDAFFLITRNVIMRVVVGKRWADAGAHDGLFDAVKLMTVYDFFPVLRRLGNGGLEKKMRSVWLKRDRFLQGLLDEARKEMKEGKTTSSLVDELLALQSKEPEYYIDDIVKGVMLQAAGHLTLIAVYVDDILITGSDQATIQQIKYTLHTTFSIKDLGRLNYFLGIEANYVGSDIILRQHKFASDLVSEAGVQELSSCVTPLPLNLKLSSDGPDDVLQDPTIYRSLVGKLNYLTNTRPDISFATQTLSQFMQHPKVSRVNALLHLLRYIKGTLHFGLYFKPSSNISLHAYTDSDWASYPTTRRSVTGYVILYGSNPITWKSKKQTTVSKSSSEAEYRAMSHAASEVTWLVRLLQEIGDANLTPVTLHCDNKSAIHIANNPVFHERTKHLEIDCHFTRDKVIEGLLQLTYLPTQNQLADVLTKVLPSAQHKHILH